MTAANSGDREAASRVEVPEPQAQGRIPADTFSNRLILAIVDTGLTIGEFAARAGLDDASVSNWRKGMQPRNLVDVCQAIADAHGIDRNWLLLGGPLLPAQGRPARRSQGVTGGYRITPSWRSGAGAGRRPRLIDRSQQLAAAA